MTGSDHSTTSVLPNKSRVSGDLQPREQFKPLFFPKGIMAPSDVVWFQTFQRYGLRIMEGGRLRFAGQILHDIGSAVRQQGHILDGYLRQQGSKRGECAELNSLRRLFAEVDRCCDQWSRYTPRARKSLERKMVAAVLSLDLCRDEFKRYVRDQVDAIAEFQDDAGRENPGVVRIKLAQATQRLAQRISLIDSVVARTAVRQELLVLERSRMEQCLDSALAKVRAAASCQVFRAESDEAAFRSVLSVSALDYLTRVTGIALYYLGDIYVTPYYEVSRAAMTLLKEVRTLIRSVPQLVANRRVIGTKINDVLSILSEQPKLPGLAS